MAAQKGRSVKINRSRVEILGGGGDELQVAVTEYSTGIRFVFVVVRPTDAQKGNVLSEFFENLDKTEEDGDDEANEKYTNGLRDDALHHCRDEISAVMSSVPQRRRTLEEFLYPTTICLQILSNGRPLRARRIDKITGILLRLKPTTLSRDAWSPSLTSITLPLVAVSDLDFIQNLWMGHVIKVSYKNQICVFKGANPGAITQLAREINVLQRLVEHWPHNHPTRPRVPRFRGLVGGSDQQVFGFLEEYVDGDRLSDLKMDEWPLAQRRGWWRQIEQTITLLHQHDFIWGDVKACNILVDRDTKQPWLIDFGGSTTDGWVDKDLAETREGDFQGLHQLVKYLVLHPAEGGDDNLRS